MKKDKLIKLIKKLHSTNIELSRNNHTLVLRNRYLFGVLDKIVNEIYDLQGDVSQGLDHLYVTARDAIEKDSI